MFAAQKQKRIFDLYDGFGEIKTTEQAYAKHKVMHKFQECRVLWGVLENLIKCWYCKPIYKSRKWHGKIHAN